MNTRRFYVIASGIVLAGCLSSCANNPVQTEGNTPVSRESTASASAAMRDGGKYSRAEYASDSTNVFVGTVTEVVGRQARGMTPEAQVRVVVDRSLKGDVPQNVTVNLYNSSLGVPTTITRPSGAEFPDDLLVSAGSKYVFFTRFNSENHWFTVTNDQMLIPLDNTQKGLAASKNSGVNEALNAIRAAQPMLDRDGRQKGIEPGLDLKDMQVPPSPTLPSSPMAAESTQRTSTPEPSVSLDELESRPAR